ncbi:class I SAM-dependent methyltransferase [Gaetbulibacter sp. PBL-D1]|uniref:class I SAM-dependent methyltransferase n=1 Tax=Gaetbulibacter sp. PBL-D1 TaxID=3422594 RepID=UPI003D2F35F1
MKQIKSFLKQIKPLYYLVKGRNFLNDSFYIDGQLKTKKEQQNGPSRTVIINYILSKFNRETVYLEIGVRNPKTNFNKINSHVKFGVDPGYAFKENPVDFKMTSDEFFNQLEQGNVLSSNIKFDVIFIDGSHLAEQVDKDIENALKYIKEDGFIVMHDCNPPTQWHAREEIDYTFSPAGTSWNGTTWKAFVKWRSSEDVTSCCIDADWGIGVLSPNKSVGNTIKFTNVFFEYNTFSKDRKRILNLIDFNDFKSLL